MTITDPTALSATGTAQASLSPVGDEFDLGITQEAVKEGNAPQEVLNSESRTHSAETQAQVDLTFDLPEQYEEQPIEAPSWVQQTQVVDQDHLVAELPLQNSTVEQESTPSFPVSSQELSSEASFSGVHEGEHNETLVELPKAEVADEEPLMEEVPHFDEGDTARLVDDSYSSQKMFEETAVPLQAEQVLPASDEFQEVSKTEELPLDREGNSEFWISEEIQPTEQSESQNSFQERNPFLESENTTQDTVSEESSTYADQVPSFMATEGQFSTPESSESLDNERFFAPAEELSSNELAFQSDQKTFLESSETVGEDPVEQTLPVTQIVENSPVQEPVSVPLQESASVPLQESVPTPVQETATSSNLLNLDDMIAQFSQPHTASQQVDPFQAMKATLQAEYGEANSLDTTSTAVVADSGAPLTATALPEQQLAQSVSPLGVEQMASNNPSPLQQSMVTLWTLEQQSSLNSAHPLTAPVAQATSLIPQNQIHKWVKFAFAGFAVLALGVVMIIRYPDLFSANPVPSISETQGTGDEFHGAAPLLPLEWEEPQASLDPDSEENPLSNETIDIADPVDTEESEMDIQTIDLTKPLNPDDSSSETTNSKLPASVPEKTNDTDNDALGAVEGLVGPINNNDLLKQEIASYQSKGQEMKDLGTAQNKRTMIKYWLAVEKEAQKLLDELANGGNIDISRWSELKSQLDDYLAKASNA